MATTSHDVAFCEVEGGSKLAYASMGNSAAAVRPLVMVPGWLCHLEQSFTHPAAASARAKLAAHRRFVWYDRLGCGLSDRDGFEPSLENDVRQLEGVLDAVGAEQVDLIGYSFGAPPAAVFAARHPERVGRLVFVSAFARGSAIQTEQQLDALKGLIRSNWGLASRTLATLLSPNTTWEDLQWFTRFQRVAATATMAARLLDHQYSMDVRDQLASIRSPSLVIHNRYDRAVPFDAGLELAASVPGAELHVLEGNEHDPFIRDSGSVVEAILDFVAGRPVSTGSDRVDHLGDRSARPRPTARELEVLRRIALGDSNRQIAKELHITVATVERHVTNLYRKLDARGRADAVMAAVGMGLVTPPDDPLAPSVRG